MNTIVKSLLAAFGSGTLAVYEASAIGTPELIRNSLVSLTTPSGDLSPTPDKAKKDDRAVIQIALLLDTSSSMDGLINQARTYLWNIVNEMTLARQNGKLPHIQIALYEYGNTRLSSNDVWIRQVTPFTDDLDQVSEYLFKLNTNGGTECCGAVINKALKELKWNKDDPNALKLIFIAGNEEFNQGNVPYASAIAHGLEQGITVNTIYCGSKSNADAALWKDGAKKGDGSYINIDQNSSPPEPETPFDKDLSALGTEMNSTYMAYGSRMQQQGRLRMQMEQDKQAQLLAPSAAVGRAEFKGGANNAYFNGSWDMVDLYHQEGINGLSQVINAEQLPKELQGKNAEEIEKVVEEKALQRAEFQKKIQDLSKQRNAWIQKWRLEHANKNGETKNLNDAIIEAVRKQASGKQFTFEAVAQ